jgi:alpha-glucosidase (family GH31 glycosyl hydrolase)
MWPEVARVTRETLLIRYTLLPYLYTLFHKAHTDGSPVLRPLFFEFPSDTNTYTIDEQMLWGNAFMISPALYLGQSTVRAYFPDARWYSYYDGSEQVVRGANAVLDAPLGFIPLHIQGGYILPTQRPANSTEWSRYLPMGLIVALDDTLDAAGSLFWDDGDSVDTFETNTYYLAEFSASNGRLTSSIVFNGYSGVNSLYFDDVRVMGIPSLVNSVTVNGQPFDSWTQSTTTKQLVISDLNLPINTAFTIVWT